MMNSLGKLATVLLLAVTVCFAQSPNQYPDLSANSTTFDVFGLNPVPVPGASLTVVGQTGNATWYFWASANFQLGSVVSPLGSVSNAANTLSVSNYVQIIPYSYPAGASTVDILATTTPVAPTGACNCAVATGLTSGGANFTSNTLSSYTVSILNPSAFKLRLTNEVVGSGSAHLLLRNAYTGALIADLSNVGAGNLPTGCSSGQVPQWNGTTWVCASGGTGTVSTTGTPSINTLAMFTGSSTIGNSFVSQANNSLFLGTNGSPLQNSTADPFGVQINVIDPATGHAACTGSPALPLGFSGVGCTGQSILYQPTPSSYTGALGVIAGLSVLSNHNPGGASLLLGALIDAANDSSATEVRGLEVDAYPSGSGTVTTNRGIVGYAGTFGSTTNEAIYAISSLLGGTGSTTNDYTMYIDSPTILGTGAFTHHYGLYIADQTTAGTGTNSDPHAIVTAGTAPSSFGGNLSVAGATVIFSGLSGLPSSGRFCLDIGSTGQIFVTTSDCGSGGGGGGANTALSNLLSVSINTSLLAQSAVDLGSTANPFRNLYLYGGGTYGTDSFEVTGTSTSNRVVTLPDNTGTIAETNFAQTYTATQTFGTNLSIGGQLLSGGVQGSGDTKALLAGAVSGTAAILCTDSNGGATTSGCPSVGFSPTITSPQQTQTLTYNGTAWVNGYGGVNVDPQTGNYTLSCPTDRLGEIEFNISTAATLTLPQAGSTTCLQSNYAVVVRNTSTSTAILTVAATTSTFQPEAVSSLLAIPGAAYFIYSDATTSTGNYHAIPISTAVGGVNIQTTSYTMTLLDKDKLVIMNCSAPCTVTFPATPPSSKWNAGILSIGSTTATVALNSLDYNGGPSVPVLIKDTAIRFTTDGSNYFGDSPLIAGSGIGFTPAANGLTIALASIAANSVLANFTGSSAAPTANTVPSCSAAGDALNYTSATGFTCATTVTNTIASGTAALGTGAIASGACATAVTATATGAATTDIISFVPNADPTSTTGYAPSANGSLYIWGYPTVNNVNFKVCNNTAASITPAAVTVNWRVMR